MFKMLEVIGTSPVSFSTAVKNAIEELLANGEHIHFFEVLEQRGAVRNGQFKEFQVKLKVAVEYAQPQPASDENTASTCPTCNQPAGPEGHLCIPKSTKDKTCEWCGALIPDERHLCDEKIKQLSYICNSCGRTAVKAEYLCHPQPIKRSRKK